MTNTPGDVGYLFLVERLSPDHELHLLLINTIRKVMHTQNKGGQFTDKAGCTQDLSSNQPATILLALHTIVKLPSRDLGPAVTPLLISKPLLRHTSYVLFSTHIAFRPKALIEILVRSTVLFCRAAIRQRTYQALVALHLSSTFPRTPQPHSQAESVPFSFPLSMSKVVKAVCRENDSSCLCVLFKLLGRLIHVSSVSLFPYSPNSML